MSTSPALALVRQRTSPAIRHGGVRIGVRPLRVDDRDRQVAFVDALSERSRYFRLFRRLRALPTYLLDQLMDVDYERRMAFAATVDRDGVEEFIGMAYYAETNRACAEVAVVISDAWQRRGVGRLLLGELIRFAYHRDVRRLTGAVLADNEPAIALAHSLGFQARFDRTHHLFDLSLELVDSDPAIETYRNDYASIATPVYGDR